MGAISPLHLIIVLIVAVLILGPGKLPEVGAALGGAMKSMRDALEGKDPTDASAGTATATAAAVVAAPAAAVAPPVEPVPAVAPAAVADLPPGPTPVA